MTVHEDYSREAWSRRKRESSVEESPPRRYQYWETPHQPRPRVRRVNYLFIFFGLSIATMFGLTLLMMYSLASLMPS